MKKSHFFSFTPWFAGVVLALAFNLIPFHARAASDFFEPFNYAFSNGIKQNITNFPAYGTNYWVPVGTVSNIVLTNFTLSVPGLVEGTGNAVAAGPPVGSSGLRRLLIDPITGQSNFYSSSVNGGVVYFSIAFQITDRASRAGSDDWHTANTYSILGAFGNSANANGFLCVVGQQQVADTNTYLLGVSKGTALYTNESNLHSNDVVFVVGRYTFNLGASDDECALWINPNPTNFGAASPPSGALITTNGTDVAGPLDRFNFRCTTSGAHVGSPNQVVWDEMRIGSTWAGVTPPVPPRLSLVQSNSTVVLSWPTNASGFVLQNAPILSAGSWTDDPGQVTADNGTNKVTKTMTTTTFFRLRKPD